MKPSELSPDQRDLLLHLLHKTPLERLNARGTRWVPWELDLTMSIPDLLTVTKGAVYRVAVRVPDTVTYGVQRGDVWRDSLGHTVVVQGADAKGVSVVCDKSRHDYKYSDLTSLLFRKNVKEHYL